MNTEDNSYTLKHEEFCQQINFKPKEFNISINNFKPDGLDSKFNPKNPKSVSLTNCRKKLSRQMSM